MNRTHPLPDHNILRVPSDRPNAAGLPLGGDIDGDAAADAVAGVVAAGGATAVAHRSRRASTCPPCSLHCCPGGLPPTGNDTRRGAN